MEVIENKFEETHVLTNEPKIFRERAIWGGTMFGGPLAAGYIIAHNFKVFGEPAKAKMTWVIAILSTVVIFAIALNLPASIKIPNQLIPLVYSGIAYALIHFYQGKQIENYLQEGRQWFSGWRVAGVGLICLLILSAFMFSYLYLTDPTLTATTKAYGLTQNEILYNSSTISESEIDKIALSLENVGFFTNERSVSVYASKNQNNCEIIFPVTDGAWEDQDVINDFRMIRDVIQEHFSSNHVVVKLSSSDIQDVKREIK